MDPLFSLPVLNGVLPPSYFHLVVVALHILYSNFITSDDLKKADICLKLFYMKFSELYGKAQN